MRLTEDHFRNLVLELVDENPIAIRAVLKILETRFTDTVETLAVTLEERPALLVNLGFLQKNCQTDDHVKACIVHEFLHVLLGHTERFKRMSHVQNVALDAVINSIVHRTLGESYSGFFALYYQKQEGLGAILRPPAHGDHPFCDWRSQHGIKYCGRSFPCCQKLGKLGKAWLALYRGELVSDDILDLAKDLEPAPLKEGRVLIGNHDGVGEPISGALAEALEEAMKQMNGDGIWRSPKDRGVGAPEYRPIFNMEDGEMRRWRAETMRALLRCLVSDRSSALREQVAATYSIPVLSPRDRRAFLRSMWSPVLPDSLWSSHAERPLGSAHVYLDVSGSMNAEMPSIIALLNQLRRAIRMPFWAFSTEVRPATIKNGQLLTETTGGTSMNCVLRHLAKTRPACAVVVTDGYIEKVDRKLLASTAGIRLQAVVTRDGSPSELEKAKIDCIQLGRLPNG